jgi:phospholipid N-methyltransferase
VFVESIEHCYACIRKIVPDRVIIASDVEDIATCRLLSMMRVDRCMSGVPVLTSDPRLERFDLDDEVTGLDQGAPIRCFVANTH